MNETNLTDVIKYLISKSVYIISLTLIIAIIVSVISFNLGEIYRSEALVGISESDLSPSSQGFSGYENLASFAGVELGGGGVPLKKSADYVVAKIKSRSFFRYISAVPGIMEGIVAGKSFDPETGQIIYDEKKYDSIAKKWIRTPTYLKAHRLFLENLDADFDRRTHFISIIYDHSSPFFAKELIDLIVREVNNLQMTEDLAESEKALAYLTNLQSTNKIVHIEKSLSIFIESQIQKQMLANIKKEYVVEYIDEPVVPESRIYPKRATLVITTTIFSFFIIILIATFYKFVYQAAAPK